MEDVTDLLNRIKNQIGGEESLSDEELNRQLNAIYSIYAAAMGPEQLIVQASRFNAVKYIHDENPKSRLIGMERLILESRDYHRQPTDEEIPAILDKLEDKVADILSRQAVERSLEKKIEDRLEERHKEYIEEVRREIIEEETGSTETAESKRKLEKLRAMEKSASRRRSFRSSARSRFLRSSDRTRPWKHSLPASPRPIRSTFCCTARPASARPPQRALYSKRQRKSRTPSFEKTPPSSSATARHCAGTAAT